MFLGFFGVAEFESDIFFCQIRHIFQDSLSTVPRITFLKNVKNEHYGICSKIFDNLVKYALINKIDVRFEFCDPKNP